MIWKNHAKGFSHNDNMNMDKYGLIGYPLGHSFSVGYFNEKFQN